MLEESAGTATGITALIQEPSHAHRWSEICDTIGRRFLERGGRLRIVYAAGVYEDRNWLRRAQAQLRNGVSVRTGPHTLPPLIMVDGKCAIVSVDSHESGIGVMKIDVPSLTAALDLFATQMWQQAAPLQMSGAVDVGLTESETALLVLLSRGYTDAAAARHLGYSLRTVARMMSRIMIRLNASSRFEAGVKAQRLGWLEQDSVSALISQAAPCSQGNAM
ncbi:helix-turn-helix transcriptional regulator [Streptomyces sp. NPDC086077]|uniref:helix-turn-helix transcriptional regulator n=1 Tax=Streptomyces sp. NPDC086077 TaxID=3154862 RepID=UPI003428C94D